MNFAIDCVVKFIGIQGEKCTNLRSTVLGQNFCAFPQSRQQVAGKYLKSGHGRSLPPTFEFLNLVVSIPLCVYTIY